MELADNTEPRTLLLHDLGVTTTFLVALAGLSIPDVDLRPSKNPLKHRIQTIVARKLVYGNTRFC